MRSLIIGSLTLGLLAAAAYIAPPATAQDARKVLKVMKGQSIKDPSALGSEVSVTTTYSAKGGGINCNIRCANGVLLTYHCPRDPEAIAVHCAPKCSPPPPEEGCIYE